MTDKLQKLQRDWEEHPNLKFFHARDINHAAERIQNSHEYLMSVESGHHGYLYQKQVKFNQQLKEELCQLKQKLQNQN